MEEQKIELKIINMADIQSQEIEWLWYPFIPYLNYPYWSVSKKDGTADRRVKKNYIIWKRSKLYVENYLVFTKRPYELVGVVKNCVCKALQ